MIGGGLAGLAAACALADGGASVVVLERRRRLGGRASSFADPVTGQEVDVGQHVFLGCCSAYIDFLRRVGAGGLTHLQPRLELAVVRRGRRALLREWPLPAPLHLLPSLLTFPHLGWADRLRALVAVTALLFTDHRRPALEGETFAAWLRRYRQSEGAIARLWDLVVLATLNERCEGVSARMGAMAFREALLLNRGGARIGYARVPLSRLLEGPVVSYLEERGGRVVTGVGVARLEVEGEPPRVAGAVDASGRRWEADAYLLAVPWHGLADLLPPEWARHPFFARPSALEPAPIVNVNIWYDRPVMEGEFCAFLDSPVQFVFNRSAIEGKPCPPQHLVISLSGAGEYIGAPEGELRRLFLGEMARLFPGARDARVLRFLTVRQPRATFRPAPGSEALRPPQVTPLPNLFLAGEWTRTGWPSTMEGAVRSGALAARCVLARAGAPAPQPVLPGGAL